VGLPLEAVGYLIAIDKVIDTARTALNVAGQLTVPVLVARSEGLLDDDVYNAAPAEPTSDDRRTPEPVTA
jgi:Na+/H+-dicarboxylate symporter